MRFTPPLLVLTATAAAAHAAPTADALVTKVQGYYKKVAHLRGEFRQDVADATFGTSRKSHGKIELARPGKLRFDYANTTDTGTKRSFRSDGKHAWEVDFDNKEIDTKDISKDPTPAAVGALTGTGDLAKDFTASLSTNSGFGADTDTVVQLDPKQPSAAYKKVFLVVDPADGHIKESVVIDSSGNVNQITFDKLDAKASVPDSDFIVDTESKLLKGYRVVDADKPRPQTDK